MKKNIERTKLHPFILKLISLKSKSLHYILVIISIILCSFSDPYSIKRISDKEYRYEFYTTNKTIKPKENKIYFWFKGGIIHNAQSGIAGELLNDKFVKMYHSNQLAEQGVFKKGLKIGLWKTWYKNGYLETTQKWKNGLRSGDFYHYAEDGSLLEKGKYKKGIKHGSWINFVKKDTIVYKNGTIFIKKVKPTKEEKEKLREEKLKNETAQKALTKDSKSKTKKSFFKRLFNKNQSKNQSE